MLCLCGDCGQCGGGKPYDGVLDDGVWLSDDGRYGDGVLDGGDELSYGDGKVNDDGSYGDDELSYDDVQACDDG